MKRATLAKVYAACLRLRGRVGVEGLGIWGLGFSLGMVEDGFISLLYVFIAMLTNPAPYISPQLNPNIEVNNYRRSRIGFLQSFSITYPEPNLIMKRQL